MTLEQEPKKIVPIGELYNLVDSYTKQANEKREFFNIYEKNPVRYPGYREYKFEISLTTNQIHQHLKLLQSHHVKGIELTLDDEKGEKILPAQRLQELKMKIIQAAEKYNTDQTQNFYFVYLMPLISENYKIGKTPEAFEKVKKEYESSDAYNKDLDEEFRSVNEKFKILNTLKKADNVYEAIPLKVDAYLTIMDGRDGLRNIHTRKLPPIDVLKFFNHKADQELDQYPSIRVEKARQYVRENGIER